MAILVLSSPLPSQPFGDALRALAPDVPVWSEADAPPAGRVEALLAWRLKPGTVSRYPRLRVLCSVGAGADKLLVDDLPEHVAVTRAVDPLQEREMARYVLACTRRFI